MANRVSSPVDPSAWRVDKVFQRGAIDGSIAVRVQRRDDPKYPRPSFSIQVGRIGRDERFSPYIPVFVKREGLTMLVEGHSETVAALVTEATDYIAAQSLYVEQAIREKRERADIAKSKPVQKPGLKELAKRDAAKRDEKSVNSQREGSAK